jgi:hypothetical protein
MFPAMLKQYLIILTLFFCTTEICLAQSTDSIINDIRVKYKSVRDNLKNYSTKSIDLSGESTEGGQAKGYYKGKQLKLIEITSFGETGKSKLEYYFDNGQLFFALELQYKYNRPIYWDKKHMQENNDTEAYDPKKTIVTKDRYYFHQMKLIRWLNNENKEVNLSLGTNIQVGQGLIAHTYKTRDELSK